VDETDLRELVRDAASVLAASGIESARHDAEALLAIVLGRSRATLPVTVRLERADRDRFRRLVERRARREPLQHLSGRAAFRYTEVEVGPGVFVPRPETELLAGAAIDELRACLDRGVPHPRAVDLCTGSGAVALAIATEVPAAEVTAVELLASAHAYAERNLRGTSVDLRLGDIRSALDDREADQHVVVANPPYIPLSEYESVDREAREFDPPEALWAGSDGLDLIAAVEVVAGRLLVDGGLAGCEHADVQGEPVVALFASTGRWDNVRDHPDLGGRPRFVTARRRPRALAGAEDWHDVTCE
jgi:release factor glutamine methyltransferase